MDKILSYLTYQQIAEQEQIIRNYRNKYAKRKWKNVKNKCPPPPVELLKKDEYGDYEGKGVAKIFEYYSPDERCFTVQFWVVEKKLQILFFNFKFMDGYTWYSTNKNSDIPTVNAYIENKRKKNEKTLRDLNSILDYIGDNVPKESQDIIGNRLVYYWEHNVFWNDINVTHTVGLI